MCQGISMNFNHYRAYVNSKMAKPRELAIIAENFEEVKKLLESNCYDVEKVDELVFVTSNGEVLATFNVRRFIRFGKVG